MASGAQWITHDTPRQTPCCRCLIVCHTKLSVIHAAVIVRCPRTCGIYPSAEIGDVLRRPPRVLRGLALAISTSRARWWNRVEHASHDSSKNQPHDGPRHTTQWKHLMPHVGNTRHGISNLSCLQVPFTSSHHRFQTKEKVVKKHSLIGVVVVYLDSNVSATRVRSNQLRCAYASGRTRNRQQLETKFETHEDL